MKRGKGRRTLTDNVRIVMGIYPMEIPLFPLQPATIGLLMSDDKGYGIRYTLSWGYRYGTADFLQGRKGEEDQPPSLYDPVLGRIEASVNYAPDKLIVDGMDETYDFILDQHTRELIHIWDRVDDAYRATLIPGTDVEVPLRTL